MKKVKRIHFVGIKGVGMTPLAIIAKQAGSIVSGSDVGEEYITDKPLKEAGITPLVGFSPDNITNDIELVITTGAHGGYDNIEVKKAKELGIPVLTKGEAVAEFMKGEVLGRSFSGIAVAGSHGKTTTTGMLVTILEHNTCDPSYVIGTSAIGSISLPGHFGKGKYFIAEADEYATEPRHNKKAQFLWQNPDYCLFTNIELDHPDIYPTVESVVEVFQLLTKRLPEDGVVVGCGDDAHVRSVLHKTDRKTISYGFSPQNDYVITRVHVSGENVFFHVTAFGTELGEFRLLVPGDHNVLNALGAVIIALELGLTIKQIKAGLVKFTGSRRRLELRGYLPSGAVVYDDYAHHPTEIQKTLSAVRQRFPGYKIVAFFQPHTYSRTKTLFSDFVRSFRAADEVVLTEIFGSAREEADPSVSSRLLVDQLQKQVKSASYLSTNNDIPLFIKQKKYAEKTVIIIMGAGDIYKIIDQLPLTPVA